MRMPADHSIREAISGLSTGFLQLHDRLSAHGIECFNVANSALMDVCISAGMSESDYWNAREALVTAALIPCALQANPLADALHKYDASRHNGAANERVAAEFRQQLSIDCSRVKWAQPYSKDGIKSTIEAAANLLDVRTGKRAFSNYKPILVTPAGPSRSLVATLYWPGLSPMSPDAGLDWQFCLSSGGVEQARSAKTLNPPDVYRIGALKSVLVGHNYVLRHENTQQVYVVTIAMCILMLWFSDRLSGAS